MEVTNQEIFAVNVINKRCISHRTTNQEGNLVEKWAEYINNHFTEKKVQLIDEL